MVMIRAIQVRTTRDQYERIKNNAKAKGFSSLAGYLRHVALQHDLVLEQKVSEIHEHLLGSANPGRKCKQRILREFEPGSEAR
jgi:hypothetical protein